MSQVKDRAQEVIETRIGPLAFESGYPSQETVAKLHDEIDFQRACQAYLWGIPAVGLRIAMCSRGRSARCSRTSTHGEAGHSHAELHDTVHCLVARHRRERAARVRDPARLDGEHDSGN
jgi:hypothetical protein